MGDKVFLKLQPYIQSSLVPRANQKLAFKFFRPFEVLARVGRVAYKLNLPPSLLVLQVPERIIRSRVNSIQQVLIKRSNLPESLATWEDLEALRQQFPRVPAWVKQALREGEMLALQLLQATSLKQETLKHPWAASVPASESRSPTRTLPAQSGSSL